MAILTQKQLLEIDSRQPPEPPCDYRCCACGQVSYGGDVRRVREHDGEEYYEILECPICEVSGELEEW